MAVVLAATLATFLGVLKAEFVWDEKMYILQNPSVQRLENIPRFFLDDDGVGTSGSTPYYRPFTTATFAVDYALWGRNPAGYHATNLLAHLATCAVLFLVIRRLTASPWAPFAATLLFALHPAHSEPVGYISARADLFCGLFMLLSMHCFLRDAAVESARDRRHSRLAYLLAILSKITAGVLPALMLVHVLLFDRRKARYAQLLPYGAITAGFLLLRSVYTDLDAWYVVPLGTRVASAGPFLKAYIVNSVFPAWLKIWYDLPLATSLADAPVIASWGVVAACAAGTLLLLRRRSPAGIGLAWFFASIVPVSGIAMLLHPTFIADRYLYVPLIGLAIAAGALIDRLVEYSRNDRRILIAAGASVTACALAFSLSTASRLGDWRDPVSLWRAVERVAPEDRYVLSHLGEAYKDAGRLADAERVLLRAVSLPGDMPDPFIHLAAIAFARQDLVAAARFSRMALALEPLNPVAMNFLGVSKAARGKLVDALICFTDSIQVWPDYAVANKNLQRVKDQIAQAKAAGEIGEPGGQGASAFP